MKIVFMTFAIVIICFVVYVCFIDPVVMVQVKSGRKYAVAASRKNKYQIAETLDRIYRDMKTISNYMYTNKIPNKEVADRTNHRMNSLYLRDAGKYDTDVAFTLFKGYVMRICVVKNNDQIEDYAKIIHVALHEMAHVISNSFNHTDEFTENFQMLQDTALRLNIISTIDNFQQGTTYCGQVF